MKYVVTNMTETAFYDADRVVTGFDFFVTYFVDIFRMFCCMLQDVGITY